MNSNQVVKVMVTSDGKSLQAAIGSEAPDLVVKVGLVVYSNEIDGIGKSLVEEASGVFVFKYAYQSGFLLLGL